jgi:cytochrome subunit of sulfide dehydrogenase
MKWRTGVALVMLLVAAAPPPGASSCSGCHGSASPIAGHDAHEMTDKLIAFRSGTRPSTVMGRIAKGFDIGELRAIAAWWASQK